MGCCGCCVSTASSGCGEFSIRVECELVRRQVLYAAEQVCGTVRRISEDLARVVDSVDGLTRAVRVAAAVSGFTKGMFDAWGRGGLSEYGEPGFMLLSDGTRIISDQKYFFSGGLVQDLRCGKVGRVFAHVLHTIWDLSVFVQWAHEFIPDGKAFITDVIERPFVQWAKAVSLKNLLAFDSCLSSSIWAVERIVEWQTTQRPVFVITDFCNQVADVMLTVARTSGVIPSLPIAFLELVAASFSLGSFLLDLEEPVRPQLYGVAHCVSS